MEFVIEPDVVYVLDKNEVLIAVLKKDDEDAIINPRIVEKQNSEATFTFSIALNNPKWQQIKNPENIYIVNDKAFSANFEGCFTEVINESNEDLISVTAYERQKLLSRKFVRAWNSTTGFEAIDTFMVVILSNGNLPLVNNGENVYSYHEKGTSGYVLDGLLYGTGWKTGTCDVEGIFDFETDQVDIYENILKVQQIWGGILVFDSLNKTVSHRDETKFLPYDGYEVKYQKNMQSLEKLYNNKIITKLCPLGEGGLNIKAVNDGSEWLTNFEYTDSILEGIENNPDIYEQDQLKRWGERKLKDLCKPRKELTVQVVLLYQKEGYELELVGLNDIVDVLNFQGIENDIEQLRVVGFDYGIWDKSDAVIELSDITLESTDIFKKNVQATNDINNGTLNSNKVIVYYNNGKTVEETLKQVDAEIINTKSELTKADDEIKGRVEQVVLNVDSLNDEIISQSEQVAEFAITVGEIKSEVSKVAESAEETLNQVKQTSEMLSMSIKKVGGNNLIKNSAMLNETNFWLKEVRAAYEEGPTPPASPVENEYWYCTDNYENYIADTMYRYVNGEWTETDVTRKALNDNQSLLLHTSASDNFANGTRASDKTISGRVILFNGQEDYSVSHIFNATSPIPVNQNEDYFTLSFYLKNSIKTGAVSIGLMFLSQEELEFVETLYSIYEPCFYITPDDINDLTKMELKVKIPKKDDFIPVIVSATAPTDTTKFWLDTNIYLPKQYNEETSEWENLDTMMSLYNEDTREVWTYRATYGFYYQTPVNFDDMQIKTVYAAFTFYPSFSVYTGDIEPAPAKGLYWNNQTTELVKRAKYNDTGFVEWETLPISSTQLPTGASLGVPMFDYIVPISGFFEIADLKLEYNSVGTLWTQFPGEVYGKNYKMDEKGFSINSGANTMFIDEDEIMATYKNINIFQINKDLAYFNKVKVNESLEIGMFILKEQIIKNEKMILFY